MESYKPVLCVIGAVLINLTLGTFYSIGNLIPYLASYMRLHGHPNVTSEHGSWLTAAFLFGQSFFIIIGAMIERRFNNRVACILGCVLHCSSTFMTIWAIDQSFALVIIIYGFGSGVGAGSSYVASIIAAQKWYPQNKGLLTGIIVGGFGFGGLVFTPLQTAYLNPDNIPAQNGYFGPNVADRIPGLFFYMAIIFAVMQTLGCILAFPPVLTNDNTNIDGQTTSPVGGVGGNNTIVTEDSLPEMRSFSDALKYRIFYVIGAMMMMVAPGVTFVNSAGKIYGQMYIKNDRFLATVVAIAAVANALGRIFWGFLMDKFAFSTCYTVKVILFSTLIALFPFAFILTSQALYSIWMLGLFFGFSGTFVLFPVFIEQVFGTKYNGTVYGVLYIALATSSIMTSLLIQLLMSSRLDNSTDSDGNFTVRLGPCLIIAGLYITSYLLYMLVIPYRRLENSIRRRIETTNMRSKNNLYNRQDLFPADKGTLAEKIAPLDQSGPKNEKETSLGSIVRYRDGGKEQTRKVTPFPRPLS